MSEKDPAVNSKKQSNLGQYPPNNNPAFQQLEQHTYTLNFQSKFQSLQKLKPIQGGGGGSILSQTNIGGGMSYIGQMESSNSSNSNLSLKARVNLSPQQQHQLQQVKSGQSLLQKCNSSPMNSFIRKSNSRPLINNSTAALINSHHTNSINHLNASSAINAGVYNSIQPYREMKDQDEPTMEQMKFVYKSNSQKSINWEGTPQNQTHKSVNNKNTGSQSHHSLFSQGKNGGGVHGSSKKMLMPSGSSGTLFRKEIIEMDEVNSSSSSSIGREENANHAFNGQNKLKKIGKLNFTGKPFAPDSIFINNIGKNLGDEDDGEEFDHISDLATGHQPEDITQTQQSNMQNIPSQKQAIKVLKSIKNGGSSKKNIAARQISPTSKSSNYPLLSQPNTKAFQIQGPINAPPQTGRSSMNPSLQTQLTTLYEPTTKIKSKQAIKPQPPNKQTGMSHQTLDILNNSISQKLVFEHNSGLVNKLSQTQKVRVSFVESNNMTQLNNVSGKDEGKAIITSKESNSLGKHPQIGSQYIQRNSYKQQVIQKINQNVNGGKVSRTESISESERQQMFKNMQYTSNQVVVQGGQIKYNYNSKSPAEKMIESSLLQGQMSTQNSAMQPGKKLMTQDLQGISQQILTPSKAALTSRKSTKDTLITKSISQTGHKLKQQSSMYNNERKSLAAKQSAKASSQDLSNMSHDDYSSPTVGSRMRQQQQKNMMLNELSKQQSETVQDELNYGDEEIIQEQEDEEGDYNHSQQKFSRNHQQTQHVTLMLKDDHFILTQEMNKIDQSRLSPSKSNKVPSSLAFKRRSNDSQKSDEFQKFQHGHKRFTIGSSQDSYQFNYKLVIEDEHNTLSSRRADVNMFSLKNKEELNRNIPFSKLNNVDFSGIYIDGRTQQKVEGVGCADLILSKESLYNFVQFLDFENLLKLMSLNKTFREGFTSKPSAYQVEINKVFKSQLRKLLIIGLPSTLQRIQYWNFRTKFFYGKKKKPNLYKTLKRLRNNEIAVGEIKKDVYRTFPEMKFFQKPQKGQAKLFNILNALAQKNSSTGYIQGMNFLAGTILINLQRGEETFWMMLSILNKYKFDSILDLKNGGLFQILCFQLEVFMQNYIPELSSHLKKLKIPTDIYAANWFITMFCYELSLDLVFCILDVFLLEGIKSLLRVSLALLKCLEEQLLQMNFDECMVFLSHCQKDIQLDSQTLLETAYQFKITNSLLQDLELYYRLKNNPKHQHTKLFQAFTRLQLQEEKQNNKKKLYWIILPATPEDLKDLFKHEKTLTEDDILMFYASQIQNRKLREIVEELQTDEDSEIANVNSYAIEKKDIQNAKMLQPSQRKKDTLHSKYSQSAAHQQKRKTVHLLHFKTDSNNTIAEMTNDFSKGGNSGSNKINNNLSYVTSHLSAGEKLQSSLNEHQNLHLSLIMKPSEDMLVTPRKIQKINQDFTSKNKKKEDFNDNLKLADGESPFIQIGSKIKSIFGNFFKTQEKLNRSFEEIQREQSSETNMNITSNEQKSNMIAFTKMNQHNKFQNDLSKKQTRSKSIHNSIVAEGPEIRLASHGYQSNQNYVSSKSPYVTKGSTNINTLPPVQKTKIQVSLEDNHNVPNNNSLLFNTTTHLQQVVKPGSRGHKNLQSQDITKQYSCVTINESAMGLRMQKQISKSVERASEIDSMIHEEECELDLLSNSDYAIGIVSENILKKREEGNPNDRPEILITNHLIVGDEELNDSNNHMEIQTLNINSKYSQFQNSSMNSTMKLPLGQQSTLGVGKRFNNYNSNTTAQSNILNTKTMKSSPPVSPKERNYSYSAQKGQIKTPHFIINKKK